MTNRPELHICIASDQNVPNLIPAFQCEAKEVWILQTPTMRERNSARHLAAALSKKGIQSETIDFPEDSVETINRRAEDIAARLDEARRPITINISGGTKLMTLSLVQTLAGLMQTGRESTYPHIVYTDTRRQTLEWLLPEASQETMQAVVRVDDVLRVNGYTRKSDPDHTTEAHAKWLKDADARKQLTNSIAESTDKYRDAIGMLNRLASDALKDSEHGGDISRARVLDYAPSGNSKRDSAINAYLRMLEDEQLIACEHGTKVTFMSRDAARYCSGGWLEEFAALKADAAQDLRGDWRANVLAQTAENKTLNEIDLMLVHDNRTLIVECKAGKFDDDDVNNWLSKLKDLAERVGGSQATRMLLSVRRLSATQIKRAADLHVRVCCGPDVAHFGRHLHDWMAGTG